MTVFMVTHDIAEAFKLGTRVITFDKVRRDPQAPGCIWRQDPPMIFRATTPERPEILGHHPDSPTPDAGQLPPPPPLIREAEQQGWRAADGEGRLRARAGPRR
jgi:NitT/TauT family transport system ATP-binding protein